MSVVLSLLDSCDFSGSDTASVIVEGPPVSERNWACKHLTALSRAFSSCSVTENKDRPQSGQLAGFTGERHPPSADSKNEDVNKEDWQQRTGGDAVCQGTVIEDCWSDCDRSEEEEGADGGGCNDAKNTLKMDYKIPCDNHGLSHLFKPRKAGSPPLATSLDPPSATPDLLTLQQELDRDPEAQMLAVSTLGCIIRRCLFREGKGGVHLSNYGQARLEGNVFRGLNYAVRCIQNSTVSKMIIRLLLFFFFVQTNEALLEPSLTIQTQGSTMCIGGMFEVREVTLTVIKRPSMVAVSHLLPVSPPSDGDAEK